jgi:ribosomal protein S18 acetylase RimI-like enzyme
MRGDLRISNTVSEAELRRIHRFLAEEAYWSKGISIAFVRKALANSLCFVGHLDGEFAAFGRVVTDLASFGYLKDIFVSSEYRGRGIGKLLVGAMLERLEQEGVGTLMLATADAHGLYRRFGFESVGDSPKLMRRSG